MGVARVTLLNGHRSYHPIESGFKRAWSHSCSRALISDIPDSVDNDTYTGVYCLKMVTSMTNGEGSCRNEPFLRSFRLGSLLPISLSRRNVDGSLHIGYILTEDIIGFSGRFMPKEAAALEHACPRVSPTGHYPTFPTASTSRLYLGGVHMAAIVTPQRTRHGLRRAIGYHTTSWCQNIIYGWMTLSMVISACYRTDAVRYCVSFVTRKY